MDKYLLMMYLTMEQETAVRHLFLCRGWKYSKQDLSKTTEEIGPLEPPDQPGPTIARITKRKGRPPKQHSGTGEPKSKARKTGRSPVKEDGSANVEPSLDMECVDGSYISSTAMPTDTQDTSNNSSLPSSAALETTSPSTRRSGRTPKPNLVYMKQEQEDTPKKTDPKTGPVILSVESLGSSPSSSSGLRVTIKPSATATSATVTDSDASAAADDTAADVETKDEDYQPGMGEDFGDDDDDMLEAINQSGADDLANPTAGSSGESNKASTSGTATKPELTISNLDITAIDTATNSQDTGDFKDAVLDVKCIGHCEEVNNSPVSETSHPAEPDESHISETNQLTESADKPYTISTFESDNHKISETIYPSGDHVVSETIDCTEIDDQANSETVHLAESEDHGTSETILPFESDDHGIGEIDHLSKSEDNSVGEACSPSESDDHSMGETGHTSESDSGDDSMGETSRPSKSDDHSMGETSHPSKSDDHSMGETSLPSESDHPESGDNRIGETSGPSKSGDNRIGEISQPVARPISVTSHPLSQVTMPLLTPAVPLLSTPISPVRPSISSGQMTASQVRPALTPGHYTLPSVRPSPLGQRTMSIRPGQMTGPQMRPVVLLNQLTMSLSRSSVPHGQTTVSQMRPSVQLTVPRLRQFAPLGQGQVQSLRQYGSLGQPTMFMRPGVQRGQVMMPSVRQPAPHIHMRQPSVRPSPLGQVTVTSVRQAFQGMYNIGTHIDVKVGERLFPAVVVQCPEDIPPDEDGLWVQFYKEMTSYSVLAERKYFVPFDDIDRIIEEPKLKMFGSRTVYRFGK